jgi:hypothetical protein
VARLAFRQRLTGQLAMAGGAPRPAVLELRAELPLRLQSLGAPLALRGTLQHGGDLGAEQQPAATTQREVVGELEIDRSGALRYRIAALDGRREAFVLLLVSKLSLRGLPPALTVLDGDVLDEERHCVGHASLRFDLRSDAATLLRSLALAR